MTANPRVDPGRDTCIGVSSLHPMQHLQNYFMYETNEPNLYVKFLNPELREAPIVEPGRVAYLGESSNLPLLVDDDPRLAGVVHFQLPEATQDSRAKLSKMDEVEISMLRQKGALTLPAWSVCDTLVEAYFRWVAPSLPIIDRSRFMKQYRNSLRPPSLLLLQAVFLADSTVADLRQTIPGKQLYRSVKALYDSGYEDNRVTIVQALLLIAWYWEATGDSVEDVLYWNGLATTVALGSGLHRSTERSGLSLMDRRLWKRIWWTLYIRDRSTAMLGQAVQIHTEDSDLEMIGPDDFSDDEYPPDHVHVGFFLQCVKLCGVIDKVLRIRDTVSSSQGLERTDGSVPVAKPLSLWLKSRPNELRWEDTPHNMWSAALRRRYEAVRSLPDTT